MQSLTRLQSEVGSWSRENFGNQPSTNPLLGIAEEVGELCHAHLKASQGIRHSPLEARALKKDAVGDIVIYLADYCERESIDFGKAVTEAWSKVCMRNWQTNTMGAADEVNKVDKLPKK